MMKIALGSATCARLLFSVAVLWAASAHADLQNVEVGGKIEIYGAWYSGFYEPGDAAERIHESYLLGRPVGPYGTSSFTLGGGGNSYAFVEQRTRLHASADLTDNVSAFVEFDSIDTWGEDFRSNYLDGVDGRADTSDDVELFQAYVEVGNVFGQPLRIRMGRQEMKFGSGWLVGTAPPPDPFIAMSFDAIRLTYEWDDITIDAWWSKLADRSPIEEDGDVDFYGIYATLLKSEGEEPEGEEDAADKVAFDIYWMYVRDGAGYHDTTGNAALERFERRAGLDDYSPTSLHTAGARVSGQRNAFDWEFEAAYQWGEADALGALFVPVGGGYGDDKARWNTWGGHGEVGYTFEGSLSPRLYLSGSYYGGEDNREVSFWNWLNPYRRGEASVSFNRLFTEWWEDWFFDTTATSNFWRVTLGATVQATEAVEIGMDLRYLRAVSGFDYPVIRGLPFITEKGDKDLGWQASLYVSYDYSDDITFEVGWAHYFVGDAVTDGVVFIDEYGLRNVGAANDKDADLVYFYTSLEF